MIETSFYKLEYSTNSSFAFHEYITMHMYLVP